MENINRVQTSENIMDKKETLAERMKRFEKQFEHCITQDKAIIIRLDGHCFSKRTRGFSKPFDNRFADCMIKTATDLLSMWHPSTAYTHSDEITLIFSPSDILGYTHPFNGRVNKLTSILASDCSIFFRKNLKEIDKSGKFKALIGKEMRNRHWSFDARVMAFEKESLYEVANNIIFRQRDCKRNMISGMAREKFGEKAIMNKNTGELVNLLGIDDTILTRELYGTFIKKKLPTYKEIEAGSNENIKFGPESRHLLIRFQDHEILLEKFWPSNS
jgi:tRNA(His) 5'-end guanylyltransferase